MQLGLRSLSSVMSSNEPLGSCMFIKPEWHAVNTPAHPVYQRRPEIKDFRIRKCLEHAT